jgi:PPM family protein phosphatase
MTMAQELIDAGLIDSTQAANSQFRHVLTQCLGGPGTAKVEVQHLRLQDGDRVLLCSDGLYEMVGDTRIAETLHIKFDVQEACQTLLNLALEAGGKDNTTILLARFRHVPSQ